METLQTLLFKIFLTIFLSGIIGVERGLKHKGAGMRTHILVGIGSTLIVLTSVYLFDKYKNVTSVDPTRMISGIVTGLGFLCAGTILRSGSQVTGLTTAATLWMVSCIGIAVGSGYYLGAIVVTFVVFFVLISLKSIEETVEKKFFKNPEEKN